MKVTLWPFSNRVSLAELTNVPSKLQELAVALATLPAPSSIHLQVAWSLDNGAGTSGFLYRHHIQFCSGAEIGVTEELGVCVISLVDKSPRAGHRNIYRRLIKGREIIARDESKKGR